MSGQSALADAVPALAKARVVCAGDLMLDRYVYGDVRRISPEAPIPVLAIDHETAMLGGAGNVVRNLAALGVGVAVAGAIGDDEAGRSVAELLGREPGVAPMLAVDPTRRTGIKTRFCAGPQQLLRADSETVAPLDAPSRDRLVEVVEKALAQCSVLVLSDYGKGLLDGGVAKRLIEKARQAGRTVIVDPKGADFSRYRGATILTPNRRELAEATGRKVGDDAEIVAAARSLIAQHEIQAVLVTRSQDGMTLVEAKGEPRHLKAEARAVYDVSGAGDTVVAVLAGALAAGLSLDDGARLANAAAGIVVGKVGTAVVHPDELVSALHHQDLWEAEAKLVSRDQAVERVAAWRRQGLKIGFTNGCFDLLHPGHVSLLAQARAACDRLVVGLNSDASVARLKGPSRPVQTEAARGTVMASLRSVDLVVIFGEDTPLALIEALRPDVLVKGADYTVETVVGADRVASWGGKVVLAELAQGHSTSATIARINA